MARVRIRPSILEKGDLSWRRERTSDEHGSPQTANIPSTAERAAGDEEVTRAANHSENQNDANAAMTEDDAPSPFHNNFDFSSQATPSSRELCIEAVAIPYDDPRSGTLGSCCASAMDTPIRQVSLRRTVESKLKSTGTDGKLRPIKRAKPDESGSRRPTTRGSSSDSRNGRRGSRNDRNWVRREDDLQVANSGRQSLPHDSERAILTDFSGEPGTKPGNTWNAAREGHSHPSRRGQIKSRLTRAPVRSTSDTLATYQMNEHGRLRDFSDGVNTPDAPRSRLEGSPSKRMYGERTMHQSFQYAHLRVAVNVPICSASTASNWTIFETFEDSDTEQTSARRRSSDDMHVNEEEGNASPRSDRSSQCTITPLGGRAEEGSGRVKARERLAEVDGKAAKGTPELPAAAELYKVVWEDKVHRRAGGRPIRRNQIRPAKRGRGLTAVVPWASLARLEAVEYGDPVNAQECRRGEDVYIYINSTQSDPARILDIRDLGDGRKVLAVVWLYDRDEATRTGLPESAWPDGASRMLVNWLQIVLWDTIAGPVSPTEMHVASKTILDCCCNPVKLRTDDEYEVAWINRVGLEDENEDAG
ncbi:hypothetical protein BDZ85DRAFT_25822 [Elsinoe ampelina]|uniref:BAH domain-containing protein n=1 Tax=Elsinoe ampelina TaxID=302913 RepID=A0A6A6G6C3_9PEZI|nr:hypothetical protein BDZ85DRAFT_25822 [Elsinoe ampelina]